MILPDWVARLAAVALLLMSLAAAYVLAVTPLLDGYRQTAKAIVDTRDLLARFERQASARADLEGQLTALQDLVARQGHYLDGATYAVAAASLQDNVKAIVEGQGGEVQSIQTMPSAANDESRRVAIRIQSVMTIEPLLHTIHRLESGAPYLFLDNLEIQGRLSRRARQGEYSDEETELLVWFDLFGFLPPAME